MLPPSSKPLRPQARPIAKPKFSRGTLPLPDMFGNVIIFFRLLQFDIHQKHESSYYTSLERIQGMALSIT